MRLPPVTVVGTPVGATATTVPIHATTDVTITTIAPAPETTDPTTTVSSTPAPASAPTSPPAEPSATTTSTTTTTTTSTTTTSTTTTTTVAIPVPSGDLSMAFTGDDLTHSPLWRQAERNAAALGHEGRSFDPMLAQLRPYLQPVDLAVCHLETPIAPAGEDFTTSPLYGVPPEVVDAIANAGYDRCSTASNHTADRGGAGVDRTVDVLEGLGLGQSGMARTPDEIRPRVFDVEGIPVAHLSYTFSYNGNSLPAGEEWRSAQIDPVRIVAEAAEARSMGAQIVLVSMHWGQEGDATPTSEQRKIADEITAGGLIDLVIGHHAHVLQPIEQVNGTWVMFGLGNIISNLPTSDRWPAASQDAVVAHVGFDVDGNGTVTVGRPVVYPTWVDKDAGWIVTPLQIELARTDLSDGRRGQLQASFERTASVLRDFIAPSPTG